MHLCIIHLCPWIDNPKSGNDDDDVFTKKYRAGENEAARPTTFSTRAESANKFCENACDGGPRCTIGKVAGNVDHV